MKNSVEGSVLAVTYMVTKEGKIVLVKKVAPGVVSILKSVVSVVSAIAK